MFERILVPLDGSARAEAILPQLKRVLNREDSEIILFHSYYLPPADYRVGIPGLSLDREREAAEKYVHEVALGLRRPGAKVHARVVEGLPAESILEAADTEGATMIAMSSHGRTGLARWYLGSVAEKVLRASRVPVLLVRSFRPGSKGEMEAAPAAEAPFRKILVPTDGSPASMAVVTAAEKVGQLYASQIVVLYVQSPVMPSGPILPGMPSGDSLLEVPRPPPDKDEATEKVAGRFEHAGLQVSRLSVVGDPATEILLHSSQAGVDLIAMSTHGRSGLSRWMLGSVAERVMRQSTVPLLIVRFEGKKKPRNRKRNAGGIATSRLARRSS